MAGGGWPNSRRARRPRSSARSLSRAAARRTGSGSAWSRATVRLPSGSFTSFCVAARPIVCSPIRSARLFPASAAAKISAAADVPVSMRTDVGSAIDPSPAAAAIVSFGAFLRLANRAACRWPRTTAPAPAPRRPTRTSAANVDDRASTAPFFVRSGDLRLHLRGGFRSDCRDADVADARRRRCGRSRRTVGSASRVSSTDVRIGGVAADDR